MAGKNSLSNKIQQSIRKRQAAPRPQPVELGDVSPGRWKEVTRQFPDVLQNIEVSLADCWQMEPAIDDALVHHSLRAAMLRSRPDDINARMIFVRLEMMRAFREDIAPADWHDALRVVAESVRTHSQLAPGERNYLLFVAPFVAPALGTQGEYSMEDYIWMADPGGLLTDDDLEASHYDIDGDEYEEDDDVIEGQVVAPKGIVPNDPTTYPRIN